MRYEYRWDPWNFSTIFALSGSVFLLYAELNKVISIIQVLFTWFIIPCGILKQFQTELFGINAMEMSFICEYAWKLPFCTRWIWNSPSAWFLEDNGTGRAQTMTKKPYTLKRVKIPGDSKIRIGELNFLSKVLKTNDR